MEIVDKEIISYEANNHFLWNTRGAFRCVGGLLLNVEIQFDSIYLPLCKKKIKGFIF